MRKSEAAGGLMIVVGVLILAFLAGFIFSVLLMILELLAVIVGVVLILAGIALLVGGKWWVRRRWEWSRVAVRSPNLRIP